LVRWHKLYVNNTSQDIPRTDFALPVLFVDLTKHGLQALKLFPKTLTSAKSQSARCSFLRHSGTALFGNGRNCVDRHPAGPVGRAADGAGFAYVRQTWGGPAGL